MIDAIKKFNRMGDVVAIQERLRVLRSFLDLTQQEMAVALHRNITTVCCFETGRTKVDNTVVEQLQALGISASFLFGESAEPFSKPRAEVEALFRDAIKNMNRRKR